MRKALKLEYNPEENDPDYDPRTGHVDYVNKYARGYMKSIPFTIAFFVIVLIFILVGIPMMS